MNRKRPREEESEWTEVLAEAARVSPGTYDAPLVIYMNLYGYRVLPGIDSSDKQEESTPISIAAAANVSTAIVSVVSHHAPEEFCKCLPGYYGYETEKEFFFYATGMILECQTSSAAQYLCTVLTPACLFKRPPYNPNLDLNQIKIDVFGSTGMLYKAKLHACDFHNNLALIQFISNTPLPTVTLRHIDVYHSVDPTDIVQPPKRFQLPSHSNELKILPGTEIFSVSLGYIPPFRLYSRPAFVSSRCPKGYSCNELYGIKNKMKRIYPGNNGGPVLSSCGEIIGIIFNTSSFLPSNIVASWWNHYKSSGKFRRPFLGVEVANLHDADLDFLEQFITRFPDISISTAVIVTRVEENSQASCSGIRTNDVILKLDDKLVMSKLQFFETIWEKTGKSVKFNVLRVTDGDALNMSFVIEEASPDKFHQWPHPDFGEN